MAFNPAQPGNTPIFHITEIGNLPSVMQFGGLFSDAAMNVGGASPVVIGHSHIKQRRLTQYRVACAGNRFVGEFVPFYYAPRMPMLYTANLGSTGRPPGCQKDIVHLVSSVQLAINLGRDWAIADCNAGSSYATFTNQISSLSGLNWTAIDAQYWQQCGSAKQAEFLVADHFEWHAIRLIGCMNQAAANRVTQILQGQAHQPKVVVRRDWYYP